MPNWYLSLRQRRQKTGDDDIRGRGVVVLPPSSKSSRRKRRVHFVFTNLFLLIIVALLSVVPFIFTVQYVSRDRSRSLQCPDCNKTTEKPEVGSRFGRLIHSDNNNLGVEVKSTSTDHDTILNRPKLESEPVGIPQSLKDTATNHDPEISTKPKIPISPPSSSSIQVNHAQRKGYKETYRFAFTSERIQLDALQKQLIQQLATRTRAHVDNWDVRANNVKWGGGDHGWEWLDPAVQQPLRVSSSSITDMERLDGGRLFYSHLVIMRWPESLYTKIPEKYCARGCNAEEAIRHTLEYREKFKPWLVSKSAVQENSKGFIYVHGFSPPLDLPDENGSHALVWIRPGNRVKVDDKAFVRALMNGFEKAVAASLQHSSGRVGTYNVVLDAKGASLKMCPSLHDLQALITMVLEHYPGGMGVTLLTNLGWVGELIMSMVTPFLPEETRTKIFVLPSDPVRRQEVLETVIGVDNIPTWLGGTDTYQFDVNEYYADSKLIISDEEANEYLTTMPYHA